MTVMAFNEALREALHEEMAKGIPGARLVVMM